MIGGRVSRRALLAGATALGGAAALGRPAWAQSATAPAGPEAAPAEAAAEPFSFDALSEAMRARAAEPYRAPEPVTGFAAGLDYDAYRGINFLPERSRWREAGLPFWLQAFHLGWLFDLPVTLHEVVDGVARPFAFTSDDFEYRNSEPPAPGTALPGVSGFRLATALNRPDVVDELVVFQGASYFRALGRGNAYGLSARGLAINTASGADEEFPRFSAFYAVRPQPGDRSVTVFAELDSESVVGAYRFVITPGPETLMDVAARLFFRRDVENLGVAPLTSMFLYAEGNRSRFDDYRPQVHDSQGLRVRRANGDILWRALANPPRLSTSYLVETSPLSFGLHQRDRDFADYQDAEARYEARPSVEVEPLGEWGPGAVRLVEIPSDLEVNDNIVAYWAPEGAFAAGSERSFEYRLRWGMLEPDPDAMLAHVMETRTGVGGVSGVESDGGARKFVVDFKGGRLGALPPDSDVAAQLSVTRGEIVTHALSKVGGTDIWRLVADVVPEPGAATELIAYIEGYGERLSETWLYQWIETS